MLAATKTLAPDSNGNTALHRCTTAEEVGALLELGFDANAANNYGDTPLHAACRRGYIGVARALISNEAIAPEKSAQTAVNTRNGIGATPLHYACMFGNREVVKLLISFDADMSVKEAEGLTPLHYACCYGRAEVAALLVDAGASRTELSADGETPLDLCKNDKMRAILSPPALPSVPPAAVSAPPTAPTAPPTAIGPARTIPYEEICQFHSMLKKAEVMGRAAKEQGNDPEDIDRAVRVYEAALGYVKEFVEDLHTN